MFIEYVEKKFRAESLGLVESALDVIAEYQVMSYKLTVRQLYYQLVARDIIQNSDRSYKRLVGIVGDARLAGLIPWDALEDRTRNLESEVHWDNPAEILGAVRNSYRRDKWENQPCLVEVWVEKEALANVVARTCERLDVAYMACRGYMSLSEMWEAGQRFVSAIRAGQQPVIVHLGDHDPSGIDMTRDIRDRLDLFIGHHIENSLVVNRVALNMDQIRTYNPPPNPARVTDSRAVGYIKRFGRLSWELDALPPDVLDTIITDAVLIHRDDALYQAVLEQEADDMSVLQEVQDNLSF